MSNTKEVVNLVDLVSANTKEVNTSAVGKHIGVFILNAKIDQICTAFKITDKRPSNVARVLFTYALQTKQNELNA
jgi:hypothetical protein